MVTTTAPAATNAAHSSAPANTSAATSTPPPATPVDPLDAQIQETTKRFGRLQELQTQRSEILKNREPLQAKIVELNGQLDPIDNEIRVLLRESGVQSHASNTNNGKTLELPLSEVAARVLSRGDLGTEDLIAGIEAAGYHFSAADKKGSIYQMFKRNRDRFENKKTAGRRDGVWHLKKAKSAAHS